MSVHLFGVRHHGPGSAKSLVKALHKLQPDILLIEGTEEMDDLMHYIAHPDIKPPVAVLIYNPKDLGQACYYPFTEFSPEWQALSFALEKKIPIVNMDLPQAIRFALDIAESANPASSAVWLKDGASNALTKEESITEAEAIRQDPLGFMARLAGYEDGERWWEITFEQYDGEEDVFQLILKMMSALREQMEESNVEDTRNDLLREVYMRSCLRKAIKDGFERIAVVCGAWHTPALDKLDRFPAKEDAAKLKGLPKLKLASTWIPWTYERIAKGSGYGAGVISPAWYKFLFSSRENAVIEWMTHAARLFRAEDIDASSAHVIEAVRLANAVAALRGQQLPGVDELFEAAQTVFSSAGDDMPFELISEKLIIGNEMGTVPAEIPSLPIQQDIDANIKLLKLSKYQSPDHQWIKATSAKPKGGLDLRQEHDRNQSRFLHRMLLLGIHWGAEETASGREKSTFNEYWRMAWKPDFAIPIIEAGMWGNTVEAAATNLALAKANAAESLEELTTLLNQIIKADLPGAIDDIIPILRNMAALTRDVQHLMNALPSMVNILRYGDVRKSDLTALEALINELVPRICIGLPIACTALDDEAAKHVFDSLVSVHRAINLYNQDDLLEEWIRLLELLSTSAAVHGSIQGVSTRLLFDIQHSNIELTADKMSYALSPATEVNKASQWLEGFLHGSGLLLIHNPSLWEIIDTWVARLQLMNFQDLLPLLRRTFSSFSKAEREKMLQIAKTGKQVPIVNSNPEDWNTARMRKVIGTLKMLLN